MAYCQFASNVYTKSGDADGQLLKQLKTSIETLKGSGVLIGSEVRSSRQSPAYKAIIKVLTLIRQTLAHLLNCSSIYTTLNLNVLYLGRALVHFDLPAF